MKVLIVTNLYPPHHHGGYELRCAQVAEHLLASGHDVRVVTSRYRVGGTTHLAQIGDEVINGVPVSRFLRHHRLDAQPRGRRLYNLGVIRDQVQDIQRFGRILDEFAPDVVNWWNCEGVTKAILRMPSDRGVPSVHCIDDGWMINEVGAAADVDSPFWFEFWRVQWGPRALRPLVRRCLAPMERRLERHGVPTRSFGIPAAHACFISGFRKFHYDQAGIFFQSSEVVYGGVSAKKFFKERSLEDFARGPLRLLYAGYLDPERGLHFIVEALGLMPPEVRARMHLSVASGGPVIPDDYVNAVHARVQTLGLSRHVEFLGRVDHRQMPEVYAAHHMLVFTSARSEGMPMVMMEAMCAGCAVPNTGSGGAIELSERAGAPLFPKAHPYALSRLLVALERDRRWLAEVALAGQRTVLREFTIERMLSETVDALTRCAARGGSFESKEDGSLMPGALAR
jgi:glycosyltransferase involved in cell wall biosynthesis